MSALDGVVAAVVLGLPLTSLIFVILVTALDAVAVCFDRRRIECKVYSYTGPCWQRPRSIQLQIGRNKGSWLLVTLACRSENAGFDGKTSTG